MRHKKTAFLGSVLMIQPNKSQEGAEEEVRGGVKRLDIVFEDENYLVIDKVSFLLLTAL